MTSRRLFGIARSRHIRRMLLIAVAIGTAGLAILAYATDTFKSLEGYTVDTRFSVRGRERPPSNLVLVTVDAKTFDDLNKQWPFPRRVDGRVISRIAADHPAAIAFDVQLTEPSQLGQSDDLALLNAINGAHGKTVFSTTETDAKGNTRFLGSTQGTKLLHEVGSRPAEGGFPFDRGGVIRRMNYSIGHLKTLAVVTAELATHRHVDPAKLPGGSTWIDYLGPAGTIPSVDFATVYGCKGCGTLAPDFFRGKIVVVGATAPTLLDIHPTSTDSAMAGPEIQANAIDTLLRGIPLSSAAGWVNIILIILFGVAVPVVSLRLGPVAAAGVAVALGVLLALAVQLAFDGGSVVTFVYPFGALILSATGSLAVQLLTEAVERLRVRDLFARFVPENVVDEVLANADGLRLGGVQRDGTVMFTDLRGFTTLAESLSPARVIEVLNRYLSEMSDAILDHGGTLVAYMGDGIMAVFGAPLVQLDHADRALSTAREMLAVRLPRFNEWLRAEGLSEGFKMGIGLNSGHVMSGNVGSERRVEYAAVGDTTNSAARIEQLTKGTPHQLLLSDATREALIEPAADLVFVEDTEIRGRVGRVSLWSVPEVGSSAELSPSPASGPAL
jgi:adenylate cyclase